MLLFILLGKQLTPLFRINSFACWDLCWAYYCTQQCCRTLGWSGCPGEGWVSPSLPPAGGITAADQHSATCRRGHGSYTLGGDRHKMNRCCTEGIFIPTCHTSVCVYYRCRCNYLSLKRSTILCQKKRKKKMMLLLSQLWSGHNASIKASGKKGNILKVKEYFRMDKLEVIFNTGVSVMMLYCMRKIHSSPRHSC